MTACPGTERRDGKTQPCPEPAGDTPLCDAHLHRSSRAVGLLAYDYRDLEQLLPRPISQWSDRQLGPRGSAVEAPVPLRLDVEALQRRIWHLSTTWAEILSDRHRLSDAPTNVRAGYAVFWAVGILSPRTDNLARLGPTQMADYPDTDGTVFGSLKPAVLGRYPRTVVLSTITGAQGLLDLAEAHSHARSMLGLTEPVYSLPGHCQNRGCGRAELRVTDGSDTVWCDRCGTQMTRDDYDRYGNLFLREAV
jgi:hypothetical protein